MGYVADYFPAHVARWLDAGWLFEGARLIEFGAQAFHCDLDAARECTNAFLRDRGKTAPASFSIANVYRALGVDHTSIDVDGSHGSTFFDLNTFAPPPEWAGAFDMVNNEGTIEHLINPINGFQVAHELLKPGGVARHSIPLSGHPEHGLLYPTPKFYDLLLWENRCEALDRRAEGDDANRWLHLVYRKRTAAPFKIPVDHLETPSYYAIDAKLGNNWRVFSARRFNGDQPKRAPMSLRRSFTSLKWRLKWRLSSMF
jgi:SAM-dependent methyltransferase